MGVKHSSAPYFLANILQASSLASTMGATTFTGLPMDLYNSNPPSLLGISIKKYTIIKVKRLTVLFNKLLISDLPFYY